MIRKQLAQGGWILLMLVTWRAAAATGDDVASGVESPDHAVTETRTGVDAREGSPDARYPDGQVDGERKAIEINPAAWYAVRGAYPKAVVVSSRRVRDGALPVYLVSVDNQGMTKYLELSEFGGIIRERDNPIVLEDPILGVAPRLSRDVHTTRDAEPQLTPQREPEPMSPRELRGRDDTEAPQADPVGGTHRR